jgi:hypothetical protein
MDSFPRGDIRCIPPGVAPHIRCFHNMDVVLTLQYGEQLYTPQVIALVSSGALRAKDRGAPTAGGRAGRSCRCSGLRWGALPSWGDSL